MIHRTKGFLNRTVLPAALLVAVAYNGALSVNGPEGRRAHEAARADLAEARTTLAAARARTARLSERADGLMLASLDHDLLDERLRARLGVARPGEYMVRMGDLDRLAGLRGDEDDGRFAALQDGRAGEPGAHRR